MSAKKKVFPTQPSFIGKDVYLRTATAEDVANFHHWFVQSEPQSQSAHPMPFYTIAEVAERFKKGERDIERGSFAIITKEDNKLVGKVSFFNFNPLNNSAELGILIDPDERQNGFGSEALMLLAKYLFTYRNLNKVYCETAAFNSAAIKLVESLGFKKDGALRCHHYYDGEYHDKFVYSLLRFEL